MSRCCRRTPCKGRCLAAVAHNGRKQVTRPCWAKMPALKPGRIALALPLARVPRLSTPLLRLGLRRRHGGVALAALWTVRMTVAWL